MRSFRQQRRSRHDLPALAVPALWNVLRDPRLLQRVQSVRAESFNGCNVFVCRFRNAHRAGPRERAIDMDAARATQANAAAEFRACQLQRVAQDPKQRGVGGDVYVLLGTIYAESDIRHGRVANILDEIAEKENGGVRRRTGHSPRRFQP